MFSLDVVDTDAFCDMPHSSQALYLHLSLRADDDGFVQPKRVMRALGFQDDDLKILVAKQYVIPFEQDAVIVIRHWKQNNYIRSDRYKATNFSEQKNQLTELENGEYALLPRLATTGIPKVGESVTQVRLGKDRIDNNYNPTLQSKDVASSNYKKFIDFFNEITGRRFRYTDRKAERQFKARLKDNYTRADFEKAINAMLKDPFHKEQNYKYMTPEFITRADKLEMYMQAGEKLKSKREELSEEDAIAIFNNIN